MGDNIKIKLRKLIGHEEADWIHVACDRFRGGLLRVWQRNFWLSNHSSNLTVQETIPKDFQISLQTTAMSCHFHYLHTGVYSKVSGLAAWIGSYKW